MNRNWALLDAVSAPCPGRLNEDAYGIRGDMAWVIDGASPLGSQGSRTESVARSFSRYVSGRLRRASESRAPLIDILADASDGFDVEDSPLPPSAAIGLVRLGTDSCEFAVLADVIVCVRGENSTLSIADDRMRSVTDEANRAISRELASGKSLEEARRAIEDVLIAQRVERMNQQVPDAYWVLTPDPESAMNAYTGQVEMTGSGIVLLASDGFGRLVEDALRQTWTELLDQCLETGVVPVLKQLREVERLDAGEPRSFPRLSRHDDATALMIAN